MGNIANYTQTVAGTTTVDQDRNANGLNQITSVAGWITPAYDAAGNMTTIPQPGNETVGLRSVYDAWNRLTVVYVGDSTTPLVNYSYDGLNRRDVEIAGGQTTAFFFNGQQDIEERVSSSPLPLREGQGEGSGESFESTASIIAALPANLQNVWGLRYVDDLVLRDCATGGSGDLGINGSGLNERLYALQDANWNVVALVSTSGDVAERFNYTVFGVATALNPDFTSYSGTDYQWTTLFAGRNIDANTGLYYDRARWYDAGLAVFTSTDPLPSLNPYWYTDNNPVNATDPTGKALVSWFWQPDPRFSDIPPVLAPPALTPFFSNSEQSLPPGFSLDHFVDNFGRYPGEYSLKPFNWAEILDESPNWATGPDASNIFNGMPLGGNNQGGSPFNNSFHNPVGGSFSLFGVPGSWSGGLNYNGPSLGQWLHPNQIDWGNVVNGVGIHGSIGGLAPGYTGDPRDDPLYNLDHGQPPPGTSFGLGNSR